MAKNNQVMNDRIRRRPRPGRRGKPAPASSPVASPSTMSLQEFLEWAAGVDERRRERQNGQ